VALRVKNVATTGISVFADSRVQRIYGGTNEIMKEVISRSI